MATEVYIPNYTREMGVRTIDRRVHLRLRLPVVIRGMDLHGREFVENAHTVLVTPSGAIVECGPSLGPDQELAVRLGKKELMTRVLGQAGMGDSRYIYGISFLQPALNFWGIAFPRVCDPGTPVAPDSLIECGRCGLQRTYKLNEIESLVLHTSQNFGLHCPLCKDGTLWKLAEARGLQVARRPGPNPILSFPPVESEILTQTASDLVPLADSLNSPGAPPVLHTKRDNGRKQMRIAMPRSKARIHCTGSRDETVALLNISRGGAGFRSESIYPVGCWIRIAAPCTEASNIFVLARVVRAAEIPEGREYGVEYVEVGR